MVEEDEADWDEEERFWEMMMYGGPLAITSILTRPSKRKHGGSRPGRRKNVDRKREKGAVDLWNDYFSENPTYGELTFRRRFRMSNRLFNKILHAVCAHDNYFRLKCDAAGKPRLSPHQKITAALRQLAYGVGADAMDEYCRIAETTTLESLYRFVKAIRELYQERYLRKPNAQDFQNHLEINQARGFPGIFGSLDCMHWQWKNCPVAWQGQYSDKDKTNSIILEAIADQELWIWHAFWGLAGGNNDLNVLDRSPLLNEWVANDSANVSFYVNGVEYNQAYLLVDGIYPEWSMFISTVHSPQTEKLSHFARCQEGARKDVERAFGVLQARFEIIKRPARSWFESNLTNILMACVVLHNMILEDARGEEFTPYLRVRTPEVTRGVMPWLEFLQANREIHNKESHFKLRNDIVDHLWARRGEGIADS